MTDEPERIGPLLAAGGAAGRPPERPTVSVLDGGEDDEYRQAISGHHRDGWAKTIPARFHSAGLGDFTGTVRAELDGWSLPTDTGPRPNLVLQGPVGVGKTHAAIAACKVPFAEGLRVMFQPVGELLDRMDWRRPDSHEWLERYCTEPLLIIDDLGAERGNEWTGERLYLIVNRRWLDGLPTIVTTNLTLGATGELLAQIGERTYSRLAHDAVAIKMTGKDRRRG